MGHVFQLKETDDNDIVTFLIQEMSKAFPTLAETLVLKRDQYVLQTSSFEFNKINIFFCFEMDYFDLLTI